MTRVMNLLSCRRLSLLLAGSMILGASAPAYGQQKTQKTSPGVLTAFRGVVAKPSESTVRIFCDDKEAALGTVVSADGLILTKASELKGKTTCKLKNGQRFTAKIIGVEEKHDLAMLKIEAKNLRPIEWRESASAVVGNWLASPGTGAEPVAIGVVSVAARKPAMRDMPMSAPRTNAGYLGVILAEADGAPKIGVVSPASPASKAGLLAGDLVLKVAGRVVKDPGSLVAAIQSFQAGKTIILEIKRGMEVKEIKATLDKRPPELNRADFQNNMGSVLSNRRGGFPAILQHDQVIKPTDCGGPLVDLDGKAVGINIARAGRVESYAIPTDSVLALINVLKSGKLAPKEEPVAPNNAVADLEKTLEKLRADLTKTEAALKGIKDEAKNAEQKKKLEAELTVSRKNVAAAVAKLEKAKKDGTKK